MRQSLAWGTGHKVEAIYGVQKLDPGDGASRRKRQRFWALLVSLCWVIILTVSGGYQSQNMGCFPLTHHLGGDFDHGKNMRPALCVNSKTRKKKLRPRRPQAAPSARSQTSQSSQAAFRQEQRSGDSK